jgi:hypothetical protein
MPVLRVNQLSEQVVTSSGGQLTSSLDANAQDILNVGSLTVDTITISGGLIADPLKLVTSSSGYGAT